MGRKKDFSEMQFKLYSNDKNFNSKFEYFNDGTIISGTQHRV